MTLSTVDLKRRFKMALALENMSVAQWAREHSGDKDRKPIMPGHLHQVLDGRESKRLTALVEAWTRATLKAHKVRAA